MISRCPQADVRRTQNRVVQSLHCSHPVCCSAWQQLVELRLQLESLAAFCSVPWVSAHCAWRQAEIPCKKHRAQSSYASLGSLQQSCFVFSKAKLAEHG